MRIKIAIKEMKKAFVPSVHVSRLYVRGGVSVFIKRLTSKVDKEKLEKTSLWN